MIDHAAADTIGVDTRPNLAILVGAGSALALISGLSLPWPLAIASTVLGMLMVVGAEVDARTYLLPNVVTIGAAVLGVGAAPLFDPIDPLLAAASALLRAMVCAGLLEGLRHCYARLRGQEGLGFGDVKLAAAVGAWLPFEAIPLCFCLAAAAALVTAIVAQWCGRLIERTTPLPFGAFLCPALWLVFYASAMPG